MAQELHILDATALLARWPLYSTARCYTTSLVAAEARDPWSREGVELAIQLGRLVIRDPSSRGLREARRAAARAGLAQALSEADISVAALALDMRSEDPVVVTDDYALQNLLGLIGIRWRPLRTRGIRRLERYVLRCPACGYTAKSPDERICPRCGTPLRRYPRRR